MILQGAVPAPHIPKPTPLKATQVLLKLCGVRPKNQVTRTQLMGCVQRTRSPGLTLAAPRAPRLAECMGPRWRPRWVGPG